MAKGCGSAFRLDCICVCISYLATIITACGNVGKLSKSAHPDCMSIASVIISLSVLARNTLSASTAKLQEMKERWEEGRKKGGREGGREEDDMVQHVPDANAECC